MNSAELKAKSPAWIEVPSPTGLGTILVSSLVADADRAISIPVAKTHSWAQLTPSLKNFVGVAPLWRYGDVPHGIPDLGVVFDHSSPRAIAAIYLDMVRGIQPDLAIIDFSMGIGGTPTRGGSAMRRAGYAGQRPNVAIALGNRLAASGTPDSDASGLLVAALPDEDPGVAETAAKGLRAWAGRRCGTGFLPRGFEDGQHDVFHVPDYAGDQD